MPYYDEKLKKSTDGPPRITRLGTFWALALYLSIFIVIYISIAETELRLTSGMLIAIVLIIPIFGMWRGYRRDSIVDQNIKYLRLKHDRLMQEMAATAAKHKTDATMLTMVLAHLPVLWAIFAAEVPQRAHDKNQFTIWVIAYVNRPGYDKVWRNSFYNDMDLPDTEQLDFEAMVRAAADMAYVKGYLRHGANLPD